jgi:SAM-dependent methyltransferase
VCAATAHETLRSAALTAPEVWDFLDRYYAGRITRADVANALFEVRRCTACGFLWQAYHLDAAGTLRLYEEWISPEESLAKKTRADVELYEGYAGEILAIAHRLGRKPCEISVLDFGMGWGAWCGVAQAFGYRVTGFELSPRRCDYARERGIAVVESLGALAHYDFINCHHTLEHLCDPAPALACLAAALEPGGLLRISVPDGADMERTLRAPGWRAAKDALHPLEHLNCFTGDTLALLAARAGLSAVPDPEPESTRARALARRLRAWLRPRPRGTTQCFTRKAA